MGAAGWMWMDASSPNVTASRGGLRKLIWYAKNSSTRDDDASKPAVLPQQRPTIIFIHHKRQNRTEAPHHTSYLKRPKHSIEVLRCGRGSHGEVQLPALRPQRTSRPACREEWSHAKHGMAWAFRRSLGGGRGGGRGATDLERDSVEPVRVRPAIPVDLRQSRPSLGARRRNLSRQQEEKTAPTSKTNETAVSILIVLQITFPCLTKMPPFDVDIFLFSQKHWITCGTADRGQASVVCDQAQPLSCGKEFEVKYVLSFERAWKSWNSNTARAPPLPKRRRSAPRNRRNPASGCWPWPW